MAIRNAFAVEDKNLSVSTILTSRKVAYKDIDLTFKNKPSGEVFKKQEAAAVKQAVKNLLLTNYGEKPFNPDFGADLRSLLFELADAEIEEEIEPVIDEEHSDWGYFSKDELPQPITIELQNDILNVLE